MDRKQLLLTPAVILAALLSLPAEPTTFPGITWQRRTPAEEGLDVAKLNALASYMGGRGCIVRSGFLVYSWGDISTRGDVASAAKPWYSTFLFKAVEEGRIPGVDTPAIKYEPGLRALNAALSNKDTNITFRHFANQTSCYGVQESPGTAFDYNDWQMSLLWDTLFITVYGATPATVDTAVLQPKLTAILQCQDSPTFLAFGREDRPGRLAISPRDFARFGLLYLNHGNWNGTQVISYSNATMAVSSPVPLSIPRTAGLAAEMLPGQRSMGSRKIPDDQTDHDGSYSWLWWVNGVQRNGQRKWPSAPTDVYACLGHANGKRGMAVMPSRQIVISWNDTKLDTYPSEPHPLNSVFQYLIEGSRTRTPSPPRSRSRHSLRLVRPPLLLAYRRRQSHSRSTAAAPSSIPPVNSAASCKPSSPNIFALFFCVFRVVCGGHFSFYHRPFFSPQPPHPQLRRLSSLGIIFPCPHSFALSGPGILAFPI